MMFKEKAEDKIIDFNNSVDKLISISNSYVYNHDNLMKTLVKDGSFLKERMKKKVMSVMENE